jgi:predicted ATP-binding protein involved in virulence
MIKNFAITGLFGDRDVSIPFESDVKILVAENGSGKTTLLNAIFNIVAGDFTKLRGLEFQKIAVAFTSGISVEITKEQIDSYEALLANDPRIHQFGGRLSAGTLQDLIEIAKRGSPNMAMRHPRFRSAAQRLGVPPEHLFNLVRHAFSQPQQNELLGVTLKAAREAIEKSVPYQLLYFPTYRRVEEDLERLGFGELAIPASDQLIKFGMNDVRECFEKITAEIKNSSIEWFSRINGQMLTQLVDGISITDDMRKQIENPDALKIVLDRIGENIAQGNKDHILDLVRNKKLTQDQYAPLIYFLANLIKVYDQQRENDNAIKEFTKVCNKYLGDKVVVYNESKVSIEVLRKKNGEVISIGKLSSGEKQIISLFSKLYLDSAKPNAIFFDEPELSLSIEWQKQLLPHVVESKRCAFLIATTHSPFIFQNELDAKTTDLTEYIKFR